MPPAEDIQRYLTGAWRLMNGKADGLRLLDLSADGFWNSFFAMLLSLPPLLVGWLAVAGNLGAIGFDGGGQLGLIVRLALTDIAAWVLPLVGLALVAPRVGLGDRFVHYVVSSNWSSALIAWMMLPPSILQLFLPETNKVVSLLSLGLYLLTMVFSWRLTNAALGKGPAIATGVFAGMLVAWLFVLFGMLDLFGLSGTSPTP